MNFNKDSLKLNAEAVASQLIRQIEVQIRRTLKKQGAVIGVSGGIDSTVCAALCAKALGPDRVLGVMMPETDSASESETLARLLADKFGFKAIKEVITDGLTGLGCYQKRDEAIKSVFPEFDSGYKSKITIPSNILEKSIVSFFNLTIQKNGEEPKTKRMPPEAYLQIVAASNLKQRLRMTTLYYHAERKNYAVIGTGNKDEHMQGFFVKYGDGGADLKPIAHLFKTQVFELARALGVPDEILKRTPTTDTYSSEQTQEEFFFGLDFYRMDMIWYAMENHVPPAQVAKVLDLTEEQVKRAYQNIERKIIGTEYLRMPPLEIE